ncbi:MULTISPECIES: hypothetical protein [unclassified Bradyrhizobium]|uniref:hypothetical protein n=1 Tax=unclassified Bradyrhizobium TaxID=2631580 RepID=UPI002478A4E4|nr:MULTISPECIES: hypothetical protein [unclassified Bradyrhizobium]WGS22244.1 hypothetical protein MTX22_11545 [Bradyrhizobium sp. ISRA463]WGS29213.1 hypothetical protein MTX19_09325 [Bradyrhizobium sp. ISRA464]
MKRTFLVVALATAACAGTTLAVQAQEGVDRAKAAAFDDRVFGGPPGAKAYACFVRRYDADHLAQHPRQKVSAMKLLVTAEGGPEDKALNYSFRLGIQYRHRTGNFDSSGYCDHAIAIAAGSEVRFDCGVDCEGGGINVALSKDDKSATIRLQKIVVWNRDKPDDEAGDALVAGADDKIFRVDRADTSECAELVTDRKELAALRHK